MKIAYLLLLPIYLLMDIIPALIAAGASILGSAISANSAKKANEQNIALARETNQFNAEEAQKNRDYQTQMSSTAHQREVGDLMAAGLNPILSATGGQGASTPSGSSASGVLARVEPTVKDNPFKDTVQSVYAAKRYGEIEKKIAAQNILTMDATRDKAFSEIMLNKKNEELLEEKVKTEKTQQETNSAVAKRDLSTAKLNESLKKKTDIESTKIGYDTEESKANSKVYGSDAGEFVKWLERIKGIVK